MNTKRYSTHNPPTIRIPQVVLAVLASAMLGLGAAVPAAAAEESSFDADFAASGYSIAPHSPVDQNGWATDTRNPGDYDYTLAENADFPLSGLGHDGVSLRFSNAVTSAAIGQLISPYLSVPAGESSVAAAGADEFSADYTIASATGGYQEGLSIEVSIGHSTNRAGGNLIYRHVDGGLQISAIWMASDATSGSLREWRSAIIPGPLGGGLWDPTVPHDISTDVHFVDDGIDVVEVSVDGDLVAAVPTWEYYHQVTAHEAKQVRNLAFRVSGSAPTADGVGYVSGLPTASSTAGNGFLFEDISYSSSTETWNADEPTADPIIDAAASLPNGKKLDTGAVTETAKGFSVALGAKASQYVGIYLTGAPGSTPVFAGWAKSTSSGVSSFTTPASLDPGAYTVAAYDRTGGLLGWADNAITVAAPPSSSPTPSSSPSPSVSPSPSASPSASAGPLPTKEPTLPAEPDASPIGEVPVDSTDIDSGGTVTISFLAGSFEPFENVYLAWYPEQIFGGWLQAAADGSLVATVAVPEGLEAGGHTLQATGATSGNVYSTAVRVSASTDSGAGGPSDGLVDTGVSSDVALRTGVVLGAGVLLLMGGAALELIGVRRRR